MQRAPHSKEKLELVRARPLRDQLLGFVEPSLVVRESTGPVIQITERREFWENLMAAVKAEMDSGTESFMVSSRLDTTPWQDVRGYNKRKFRQLVDRIAAYYAIGK